MGGLNIVELPVRQEVPRDRGRPLVVPPEGGKPVPLQRTTTFIDVLGDKTALADWGKRMVLYGAKDLRHDDDYWSKVEQSLVDEKKTWGNQLAEVALEKAGANDKRERGTYLHGLTELVDEGKPLPAGVSEQDVDIMADYLAMTLDMESEHIERLVAVPELRVAGTPDRVVHYAGPGPLGEPIEGTFIYDTKTGSVEHDPLKIAMQEAVYSRGRFYDFSAFPIDASDKKALAAWKKQEFSAEEAAAAYTDFEVSQDWGLVLHLPSDGGEPGLYWADLQLGWEAAQLAVQVRDMRKRGKKALAIV